MLTHLVPKGTPSMLISFMVCIETTRNIIRPITLSVRLTANMIAGHLILRLLGGLSNTTVALPFIILAQLILVSLEIAVSVIQAYVFTVLLTLYSSEANYCITINNK